jgi:nicotinamidase/pyrazinamidase
MSGRPVLWDVDTQVDFVHHAGKLAVPGAEEVAPNMARLVRWAREAGITHVASVDEHDLTDPEISDAPDFDRTYPPHCLRGTPGAAKIPETAQEDPVPVTETPYRRDAIADLVRDRREIVILKRDFDVFTNPNAGPLVDALDPSEVIVFGVATDVCDHAAIVGLLERGHRVAFVEDASRGLSEERVAACMAQWRRAGVRFVTTDDVVAAIS